MYCSDDEGSNSGVDVTTGVPVCSIIGIGGVANCLVLLELQSLRACSCAMTSRGFYGASLVRRQLLSIVLQVKV
jgi:hypothetical protein